MQVLPGGAGSETGIGMPRKQRMQRHCCEVQIIADPLEFALDPVLGQALAAGLHHECTQALADAHARSGAVRLDFLGNACGQADEYRDEFAHRRLQSGSLFLPREKQLCSIYVLRSS